MMTFSALDFVLLAIIVGLCLFLGNAKLLRHCPGAVGRWARRRANLLTHQQNMNLKLLNEHDAEQLFTHLFANAPIGIAVTDLDGVIKACNPMAKAILLPKNAHSLPDLLGQKLLDLTAPESRGALGQVIKDLLDANAVNTAPLEVRIGTAAGQDRYASVVVGRLLDPQGQLNGLIIHLIDITDRKTLASQFTQSQKMQAIGQLAGGVAHDFNNLLTAMIGYCDLLLMRHKVGDPSFADIMQIKQNANRAANLVRQLLAFSRQQTLKPRVLNLVDVLAEIRHLLSRLLGDPIKLEVEHTQDQLLIKADQGQLEQVIVNLAVNARDAMPGGGKLSIRPDLWTVKQTINQGNDVVPAGDYVRVVVSDSGTGIPPELLARIFEPFFTTKELGSGTGLGLATVYGIVKQTGGYLLVESTVGVGTSFSILLPRYLGNLSDDGDANTAGNATISGDTAAECRILLVEDEDPIRLFSARALRSKGFKVVEARNGYAALEIVDKGGEQFELMITDVMMPEMDGPTLIFEIRQRMPTIQIICISGYAEETIRDRLDQSLDVQFLPKPFGLQQLLAKVNDMRQSTPPVGS
jgi:two-component system cell cycle sensor histidine kinase/response regulator CckA